jgi:glycosyltransferase involved in cell wall biosynthesis
MTVPLCLDPTYSTTRQLFQIDPKEKQEEINAIQNPYNQFETILFLPLGENRQGEGGLRTKGYFKQSTADTPLITIITVVFNGEKYLEETIQSVINQSYDNVEYIIIDGGSTDGTFDIIKKYENKIDYWVSEKDRGIGDAFNKGLMLSSGDWLGIINSDDWYESDIFSAVSKLINCCQYDVIHGNVRYWLDEKNSYVFSSSYKHMTQFMSIKHASVFVKKKIYQRFGNFSINYRIAMDYELLLRFIKNNVVFYNSNKVVANFRGGGISEKNAVNGLKEVYRAQEFHGVNNSFFNYIYFLKSSLKINVSTSLKKLGLLRLFKLYSNYSSLSENKK